MLLFLIDLETKRRLLTVYHRINFGGGKKVGVFQQKYFDITMRPAIKVNQAAVSATNLKNLGACTHWGLPPITCNLKPRQVQRCGMVISSNPQAVTKVYRPTLGGDHHHTEMIGYRSTFVKTLQPFPRQWLKINGGSRRLIRPL